MSLLLLDFAILQRSFITMMSRLAGTLIFEHGLAEAMMTWIAVAIFMALIYQVRLWFAPSTGQTASLPHAAKKNARLLTNEL